MELKPDKTALMEKLASLKWHLTENTVNREIIFDLIDDCQQRIAALCANEDLLAINSFIAAVRLAMVEECTEWIEQIDRALAASGEKV